MNPPGLAEEALRLKRAWLLASAIVGNGDQLTLKHYLIPNYLTWKKHSLRPHIKDLEDDFEHLARMIFEHWRRSQLAVTVEYFAKQYEAWHAVGFALFDLGRVQEFEHTLGRLGFRKCMDCPPYAQIILQAFNGAAIRHPEYHLASDLALLYELFLDSEALLDEAQRRRRPHCSEHSQSLGRSVVLTCFNLLESFVSGLATAFLMENPSAPPDVVKKLQDRNLSLRKRFISYPALITGSQALLDDTQSPLQPLFGECKERRDSFVHCEPGPVPTKWGYVKEAHFHDVDLTVVRSTVELTFAAICLAWKVVHGTDRPTWLPKPDANGRFTRVQVKLCPKSSETSEKEGATK